MLNNFQGTQDFLLILEDLLRKIKESFQIRKKINLKKYLM